MLRYSENSLILTKGCDNYGSSSVKYPHSNPSYLSTAAALTQGPKMWKGRPEDTDSEWDGVEEESEDEDEEMGAPPPYKE